jgi:hypothetical protein
MEYVRLDFSVSSSMLTSQLYQSSVIASMARLPTYSTGILLASYGIPMTHSHVIYKQHLPLCYLVQSM